MPRFEEVEFRAFDYDGFKQALFDKARAEFPKWTDTLESNQGVVFIEWLAYIASNMTYMQNFFARQCFIPTVTEAKNLTKLAKQFAYSIPNNVAATVDVTISSEGSVPFPADVIILKGTQLKTKGAEPVIFETIEDVVIPAGSTGLDVTTKNYETKAESDVADGSSDFSTILNFGPYVSNTIVVSVNSTTWTKVDNFLDSNGTAEHYRIEVDSDGVVTVVFGDGINGKVVPSAADIDYTYKVGGGAVGNVGPDTITVIEGTFFDVDGDPVDLVVTNALAGEGGEDSESISLSKLNIPASLSAKEVSINYSDFTTNVGAVPGVARVKPLTINDNPNIPDNTVLLIVLPVTNDVVSPSLAASILSTLEDNPTTLTLSLMIVDPDFNTIDIEVRDIVARTEFNDNSGVVASATITIANNTFDAGDTVTVNGVDFEVGVDWTAGGSVGTSATALAAAIEGSSDPLLQDITASAVGSVVTVSARTKGLGGNAYTLAKTDGATTNFTLSGALFTNGEDTTVQAAIRAAFAAHFGRFNTDENDEYTVEFGRTVYRNDLIWLIRDLEIDGVKPVVSFTLQSPAGDTVLETNEFPKHTLVFTTSV